MEQSVSQLFCVYLQRSSLAPNSVRLKRWALRAFLRQFGDIPAGAVTIHMAEQYRAAVARATSESTANTHISNLKPFWRWLRDDGKIEVDPWAGLKLYCLPERELRVFSLAELERLACVVAGEPYWQARIGLGLAGCRRGEMFNIQRSDLRLDDSTPHILLSAKSPKRGGWAWTTKNHRLRYIPVPAVVRCGAAELPFRAAVQACAAQTPADQPYLLIEPKRYRAMSERMRQGRLQLDHINDPFGNFQRSFNSVQRRASICPVHRYHDLRRTFGTLAVENLGLDDGTTALGNASVEVTRRHYRVRDRLQLVARLNDSLEKCYGA